ncbi:MAG: hypothetical protein ACTS4X_01760 [Candidatus Hodgkinia cicadicola]
MNYNLLNYKFIFFISNVLLHCLICVVSGLANLEGEMIDCDYDGKDVCTKYQLTGIVVHSGQASGGHYYSYILHR